MKMQQLRSMQDIIADLQTNKVVFDNMADSLTEFNRVMPTENNSANVQYMQRQAQACQSAIDALNRAMNNGNGGNFDHMTKSLENDLANELRDIHSPEPTS